MSKRLVKKGAAKKGFEKLAQPVNLSSYDDTELEEEIYDEEYDEQLYDIEDYEDEEEVYEKPRRYDRSRRGIEKRPPRRRKKERYYEDYDDEDDDYDEENKTGIAIIAVSALILIVCLVIVFVVVKPFSKKKEKAQKEVTQDSSSTYIGQADEATSITIAAGEVPAESNPDDSGYVSDSSSASTGDPDEVIYNFFEAYEAEDAAKIKGCFYSFNQPDDIEIEELFNSNDDVVDELVYGVTGWDSYDDIETLREEIECEYSCDASMVEEAAIIYTEYDVVGISGMTDECIVIKVGGVWYIYYLGDIQYYL